MGRSQAWAAILATAALACITAAVIRRPVGQPAYDPATAEEPARPPGSGDALPASDRRAALRAAVASRFSRANLETPVPSHLRSLDIEVVDHAGKPVAGARVVPAYEDLVAADARGRVRIALGAREWARPVVIEDPATAARTGVVLAASIAHGSVRVQLPEPPLLGALDVRLPADVHAAEVVGSVTLGSVDPYLHAERWAPIEGSGVRFDALPGGRYVVEGWWAPRQGADDIFSVRRVVDVEAGAVTEVVFDGPRPGRLRLLAAPEDGRQPVSISVSGSVVAARLAAGEVCEAPAIGTTHVTATAPGHAGVAYDVEVPPGAVIDLVVRLPLACRMEVEARYATGEPVVDRTTVRARPVQTAPGAAPCSAPIEGGVAVLATLAPGEWEVEVLGVTERVRADPLYTPRVVVSTPVDPPRRATLAPSPVAAFAFDDFSDDFASASESDFDDPLVSGFAFDGSSFDPDRHALIEVRVLEPDGRPSPDAAEVEARWAGRAFGDEQHFDGGTGAVVVLPGDIELRARTPIAAAGAPTHLRVRAGEVHAVDLHTAGVEDSAWLFGQIHAPGWTGGCSMRAERVDEMVLGQVLPDWRYVVGPLRPGAPYAILVEPPGGLGAGAPRADEVVLAAGERKQLDLDLPARGVIEVRARPPHAIAHMRLRAGSRWGGDYEELADGAFRFEVEPGRYEVLARLVPDDWPRERFCTQVDVPPGDRVEVLVAPPFGTAEVRGVIGQSARPCGCGNGPVLRGPAFEDVLEPGRAFAIPNLPAGAYAILHDQRVLRVFQLAEGERLDLGRIPVE